jgi:hypothetical protein
MASSFLSHCGSGEKFRDQTYPLFARHLKGQGVDPENPKYVGRRVEWGSAIELLWSAAVLFFEALDDVAGQNICARQAVTSTKSLFVPGLSLRFETADVDYQSGYRC